MASRVEPGPGPGGMLAVAKLLPGSFPDPDGFLIPSRACQSI